MKIKYIILFMLILVSIVSATDYDTYNVEAELSKDNVEFVIEATGEFDNEFVLDIPPSVKDLSIYVDSLLQLCTVTEEVGSTKVTCPITPGIHIIDAIFITDYPLVSIDDKTLFQLDQQIIAEEYSLTLKLPEGEIISEERFINPEPTSIYSDGRRIIVFWSEENINETYKVNLLTENINDNKFPMFGIIAILLIVILIVLYFRKKNPKIEKTTIQKKKEIIVDVSHLNVLLENEQKVVQTLTNAPDHKLWQKELQYKTGLSKVKLSRLIKSLVKRGILTKEPYGSSNIIHLKKQENNAL